MVEFNFKELTWVEQRIYRELSMQPVKDNVPFFWPLLALAKKMEGRCGVYENNGYVGHYFQAIFKIVEF